MQSNEKLSNLASRFRGANFSKVEVKKIGEESLLIMYNAKAILDLNSLRYEKFMQKVSTKLTSVDPVSLPPTLAAANIHSQRVYLQIQQWMNKNCPLNPTDLFLQKLWQRVLSCLHQLQGYCLHQLSKD